ncbi:methyltransferase family protein [Hymenobacter volaticus]|uniref:Isoprenylcysteine carboxylmethyltransferase family protein n=1 Tax=Hymenobacter volaticus TaxID=2932254 RepID=A0ABY4G8S6_9BACT|nr:isoprenylcysteine carboxylmethyltransferase family protein [Hymenobacter volaticus]UOQ67162.1 isoprenylcysteine carboxylmethyltransferase family protein [Hymenobacter volaticus]
MISIGNFFFKYRNQLFIFLYAALFIPSPPLFTPEVFGEHYYVWPIAIGLIVTVTGQLIRGASIGLVYIVRGGKDKKVYAEDLVTQGMFNHCRNPLYVGNILMLVGVGILCNSLIYMTVFIPLFLFIYQAIVLAEEKFLRGKFGTQFDAYCSRVNRWLINPVGLGDTFSSHDFSASRWILKEYNTQFVWLVGITLILLMRYPELTHSDENLRNTLLGVALGALTFLYLLVKYLKKSGKWAAE